MANPATTQAQQQAGGGLLGGLTARAGGLTSGIGNLTGAAGGASGKLGDATSGATGAAGAA